MNNGMTFTFLPHVEDSQLEELQARLESISKLTPEFLILLSGSTLIATFGLFQNSPAVIIGAMIIAPLMRPLVGLSLAALTADTRLLFRALLTLSFGTILAILIASAISLCLRSLELTPEIMGRVHPTLLDLGVAMFAGAIGAYCQSSKKLSDTLAGVAIAVALVPPLAVVGIGLAFNSPEVWTGAALLYATNLIGITIAGSLVYLLLGYTPLRQAKKGLGISAVLITLLSVPLALSMSELVLENQISGKIRNILKEKTHTFKNVQLSEVKVLRFRKPMSVVATVIGVDPKVNSRQVSLVQDFLSKEIGIPIEFKLRIIAATEVTAIEVTTDGVTTTSTQVHSRPPLVEVVEKQAGESPLPSHASQPAPALQLETAPSPLEGNTDTDAAVEVLRSKSKEQSIPSSHRETQPQ